MHLFESMRHDPDTLPTVPLDGWQEGSKERKLLAGFRAMMEQMQQRVTRLEEIENQRREREEQHRSIFESVTGGILIVELKEGRVVEANPRGCELLGYTREEFLERVTNFSDDTQIPPVYAQGTTLRAHIPVQATME